MIKKILLATDFSDTSLKAADYAKSFSEKFGASLDIACVFDPSALDFGVTHFSLNGISRWAEECKKHQDEINVKIEELSSKLNANNKHVLEGRPEKQLIAFITEKKYDLVILGNNGYGMLDRFVLGSVSEYVTRHAPCPVFVVKCKQES